MLCCKGFVFNVDGAGPVFGKVRKSAGSLRFEGFLLEKLQKRGAFLPFLYPTKKVH